MEPTERNAPAATRPEMRIYAPSPARPLVVGFTVVALVAVWFLFGFLIEREAPRDVPPSPLAGSRPPIAGPRLQSLADHGLGRIARRRAADSGHLRLGGSRRRHRSHSHRAGHGFARRKGTAGSERRSRKRYEEISTAFVVVCLGWRVSPVLKAFLPISAIRSASIRTWMPRSHSISFSVMSKVTTSVWASLVNDKPVILTLVYYECPMLCTEILNGLDPHPAGSFFRRGQRVRSGDRELRSRRDTGAGIDQEAYVPGTVRPAGGRERLALSHRPRRLDSPAHRGGGLSICLYAGDRSIRPRQRHHGADAQPGRSRATSMASTTRFGT